MKFHRFEIYDYNDLERFMQPDEQQYLAFAGRKHCSAGARRETLCFNQCLDGVYGRLAYISSVFKSLCEITTRKAGLNELE
ncbi:hypothetical protein IH879_01285 [candidate division KSB1 bacterium]|nr:hypothetical protein [candidate division KSB1 bacterium]